MDANGVTYAFQGTKLVKYNVTAMTTKLIYTNNHCWTSVGKNDIIRVAGGELGTTPYQVSASFKDAYFDNNTTLMDNAIYAYLTWG